MSTGAASLEVVEVEPRRGSPAGGPLGWLGALRRAVASRSRSARALAARRSDPPRHRGGRRAWRSHPRPTLGAALGPAGAAEALGGDLVLGRALGGSLAELDELLGPLVDEVGR
jgi:hypothetical protein